MSSVLPSQAIDAAKMYLSGYSAAARSHGERLLAEDKVEFIEQSDELEFDGLVEDNGAKEVHLLFDDGEWWDECTCSIGHRCQHTYAALSELLQQASPKERSAKKAANAPEAAPEAGTKQLSFKDSLEQKLGRKLTREEAKIARVIEAIYERSPYHPMVAQEALGVFFGRESSFGWGWQNLKLWPKQPRDPWQTWLYIANYLQKQGRTWPAFLTKITSIDEVDALVEEWERQKRLEQWNDWLKKVEQDAQSALADKYALRVVCEEKDVRLEVCTGEDAKWRVVKRPHYHDLRTLAAMGKLRFADDESAAVWAAFSRVAYDSPIIEYSDKATLNAFFRNPLLAPRIFTNAREPFRRAAERLEWKVEAPDSAKGDYKLTLTLADGSFPPPAKLILDGNPALYVTGDTIYEAPPIRDLSIDPHTPNLIPAQALESSAGVTMFEQMGAPLPPRISERLKRLRPRLVIEARLMPGASWGGIDEKMVVKFTADWGGDAVPEVYTDVGWYTMQRPQNDEAREELVQKLLNRGIEERVVHNILRSMPVSPRSRPLPVKQKGEKSKETIVQFDRTPLRVVPLLVSQISLKSGNTFGDEWIRSVTRNFPELFSQWLLTLPSDVELYLDKPLASLRDNPVSGTVRLEIESSGVDWFDVSTVLDVQEIELTPEERQALLNANGGWVRLGAKGWRRLALQWSKEDEERLADIGLSASELSGEPQRLHALQLASDAASRLLPPERVQEVRRRVEEIRTRVNPPVPAAITAELRPYQVEGYHFLCYLSANRFGGILADDMGLGKTVQTLTWLAWLREQPDFDNTPSLVVCPKSVMPNWRAEAQRFLPGLRVKLLQKGDMESIEEKLSDCDLLVVNYTQLRLLADQFARQKWHAAILDEAQAIKNPDSQTARAAYALTAAHRLALSGTPVENRLLDLWSILSFAMPGVLGPRTRFAKLYDKPGDPLARRRLSARVRPFLLRRTKNQVARDLPPRIEEDIICELEGKQETLYRAELKRARQMLLKIKTSQELDKQRMNILTSLLRLRQICCHPALVDAKAAKADSAKLNALLEMLDPLMEERHKVLVFSQFIGALEIIRSAVSERGWKHFLLTGDTENRGELVQEFQSTEGAAVFLLSLKAGGAGLNLTAASYVALFDPWWNPAVENQAIDRTHRIGQTQQVIAYRLLVKGSIEEKIRGLQKSKSALADEVLGEEAFSRGLTLDDLRFLLGEE